MKIVKERIIFNNYDIEDDGYDCYGNDMWYDFWEQTLEELEELFEYGVVMFGSVGRWNGVFEGGRVFESIREAVNYAIRDCDYVKIYDENGHLYITCSHHDGTCHFELKALNKDAMDFYDRWNYGTDSRTERQCIEQIVKRHSKLPQASHKLYGCKAREWEETTKEKLINRVNNLAVSYYA